VERQGSPAVDLVYPLPLLTGSYPIIAKNSAGLWRKLLSSSDILKFTMEPEDAHYREAIWHNLYDLLQAISSILDSKPMVHLHPCTNFPA